MSGADDDIARAASLYKMTQNAIKDRAQKVRERTLDGTQWTEVLPNSSYYSNAFRREVQQGYARDNVVISCQEEHIADTLNVDYLDGVFKTVCINCGIRLIFEKMPGQVPKIKLKAILADLMAGKVINIEDLNVAHSALLLERNLLDRADSDLKLILAMLQTQYETGVPPAEQSIEHKRLKVDALGGKKTTA